MSNPDEHSVPCGFEDAHKCWLESGGENFAAKFVSGPDDTFYESDYWKIIRSAILNRDEFRCAKCNGKAHQVHHLNYRYVGKDHLYPKSLVSVCRPCHGLYEYARKAEGLLQKIQSRINGECVEASRYYARLLQYRDDLSELKIKFDGKVAYTRDVHKTERDKEIWNQQFEIRQKHYLEASAKLVGAWSESEDQKIQRVRSLLEREAENCRDFIKSALGELYGWEETYAEPRRVAAAKRMAVLSDAALRAKEALSKPEFLTQDPLGKCPKCFGQVFQRESEYLCENSAAESNPCNFKIRLEILSQPIEPTQVSRLLKEGVTKAKA